MQCSAEDTQPAVDMNLQNSISTNYSTKRCIFTNKNMSKTKYQSKSDYSGKKND